MQYDVGKKQNKSGDEYYIVFNTEMGVRNLYVGGQVRILSVPKELTLAPPRDTYQEMIDLFEKCIGKIYPVRGITEYGGVEIRLFDDGAPDSGSLGHVLWIEPDYLEVISYD